MSSFFSRNASLSSATVTVLSSTVSNPSSRPFVLDEFILSLPKGHGAAGSSSRRGLGYLLLVESFTPLADDQFNEMVSLVNLRVTPNSIGRHDELTPVISFAGDADGKFFRNYFHWGQFLLEGTDLLSTIKPDPHKPSLGSSQLPAKRAKPNPPAAAAAGSQAGPSAAKAIPSSVTTSVVSSTLPTAGSTVVPTLRNGSPTSLQEIGTKVHIAYHKDLAPPLPVVGPAVQVPRPVSLTILVYRGNPCIGVYLGKTSNGWLSFLSPEGKTLNSRRRLSPSSSRKSPDPRAEGSGD